MKLSKWSDLDDQAVAVTRALAMDAVQKAGNGHPGTAMALAPVAYTLFQRIMKHNPAEPNWIARDRFILSSGHSSLTLYLQLYLSGYGLELEDLKKFRTYNSLTPGHPEYGHTVGVETTTGPLGQGVANAVGMAMAARYERGLLDPNLTFNVPTEVINHARKVKERGAELFKDWMKMSQLDIKHMVGKLWKLPPRKMVMLTVIRLKRFY